MANREDDERGRELARQYYVKAITATNAALRHTRRVKEDNTLVTVCLLSMFEVSRQSRTRIGRTNKYKAPILGKWRSIRKFVETTC